MPYKFYNNDKISLPDRESNPGLPRDRRRSSPLDYRGIVADEREIKLLESSSFCLGFLFILPPVELYVDTFLPSAAFGLKSNAKEKEKW